MASSSNEPSVHYSNFQSSNVDKELKGWAALSAMEMYDWTEELCEELERLTPFRRLISTSKLTYEELDSIAEDVAEKCRLFVPSNGIHFRREKDEHTDPPKEVLRTALMRRLEAAADGSNLTYTLFKVVKLVLVGQTERGKTSFAKAAYQISRGKEGGADWNPGGEEGKSGPELTFTFHWKFDHGNTAGYIPVYLIDTPGVGMAEGIDQANLKLAKENLTALVNIHGFVFVTDYTHHIIDADALAKIAQYRDMFGDAFKTRLAMLYTNFSRKGKKAKKRTQADIDAIMNADLADLAKIDCTVTKEDCFFVNSFPECPIDEKHLAFAVSSVASWGISKTPMATAEFNGLDEMEKKHTQLVEDFAPYWHFPYKIERVYDQHDRQEYLELVNEQIPWGYQSIGQVLTFGLLGWNRVITRLRLLGVKPESEDRIRFNKVYVLKYILDHLVSHGDRLYMTSLEIGGDLEREIGSLKVRTIQAKCVLERVRKTRAASYQ